MKNLVLVISLFVFSSCASTINSKYRPLQNKYIEEPYVVYTKKPFAEVWENVIDVIARNGFPVKLLDKENGLVVCERTSLMLNFTFEDKEGRIENPDAFVVLPTVSTGSYYRIYPKSLSGVTNIRIRDFGDETMINVNLNNFDIEAGVVNEESYRFWRDMRSTGQFESFIANQVK